MGDEPFVLEVLEETEDAPLERSDLQSVLRAVEDLYGPEADQLLTTGRRDQRSFEVRALAAWATINFSCATLTELARYCGRDESTMSCAAHRIEEQKSSCPAIREKMEELRQKLSPEGLPRRSQNDAGDIADTNHD